jgi:hypothetical protein
MREETVMREGTVMREETVMERKVIRWRQPPSQKKVQQTSESEQELLVRS